MPLFKKLRAIPDAPEPAPADDLKPLLSEFEIRKSVERELFRSIRYGRPLSVLRATAQLLPNEHLSSPESALIDACIAEQLRTIDDVGLLRDGSYLIVLPETEGADAMTVGQRLVSELTLRSSHVNSKNWLVGAVFCGPALDNVDDVLAASLTAALESRSRRHAA